MTNDKLRTPVTRCRIRPSVICHLSSVIPNEPKANLENGLAFGRIAPTDGAGETLSEQYSLACDFLFRSRLQEHLMELFVRHSLTMFFVTHDIDEAVALSDTIVVIKGRPGQISHQFRIDLSRPRSRHNQAFIVWKERVLEALTE